MTPAQFAALPLRQRQVAKLLTTPGQTGDKAICAALGLRQNTLRRHLTALYKALRVTGRTEAAVTLLRGSEGLHGALASVDLSAKPRTGRKPKNDGAK